ncbi:DNA polymerase I [Agarilytica rhodophyticola]|uniref:DNA polymerase I n=1 Tax=Agarilytica rhodophyticola TaxID=1737490 RepID=UPI000B349416|nr:DNA polymerase I [Agarilytica rhodophyticola]
MTSTSVPLVFVDGSSYLYRAFHALPPLSNSKGQPTGAIKGVINMLKRLTKDYPQSPIVVVFDAKGKTFRDEIFDQYKANRPPMPDDLRSQIEPLHKIIEAMGLPMLVISGVEADDVIGTLSQEAASKNFDVIISTGDKDMAQLVNDKVTLVNTMTETVMDIAGVESKFGIPPCYIIDYLALMGDKVDNIPGVPGVGEKTALALIQNLGGIKDIYDNIDKVSGLSFRGAKTMGAKLETNREKAELSYELATIKTDVELPQKVEELKHSDPDNTALRELFSELEFKSWLVELDNESDSAGATSDNQTPKVEVEYDCVLTEKALDGWIDVLSNAELFAFDTETTSLDYMNARVVGVSFSAEVGKAAYVPFGHDYIDAPEQLSEATVLAKLKPLLESQDHKKVGQNLKYDANVLKNHGIDLQGIAYDTMLESYVFNSVGSRHDMDTLALNHLGLKTIHFEDIAGKGAKQLTFNQIPLEEASKYAAEDADITLRLHKKLWPEVSAEEGLRKVFEEVELPLVPVLSRIERNGALLDTKLLAQQSAEHSQRISELERQVYDMAGEEFNLASPKQLGTILFEKLGLPVIKKTKSKTPSTAEEVLQELALDYPLPKLILEYRGLAKLKSTYTDKLPTMVNSQSGRLHTSYHQAVAATGRLSSTDPNLQNIPIKTEAGRRVRQAFVASPGHKILAADYSQIELRIMAHLSHDKSLCDAFSKGVDIHRATAAEVFGEELDSVTSEQRRSAKAINFGLIYGMSAFGLAKQLHIGRNDAQRYIDTYFERYPGVAQYMTDIREKAAEQGYVETILGRRLYLPEIRSNNFMRRQAAERTAINAPMQGSAADIIKRAMIDVDEWLDKDKEVEAKIIMQVHDELVLEVPEKMIDNVSSHLSTLMSGAIKLSIPLVVDVGVGNNWDEAH